MVSRNEDLPSLQIGALLHDIGKFWQRTGQRHGPGYDRFDKETHGAHGAHAKWSAEFIERFVPAAWKSKAYDVLTHHKPTSRDGKIIALADWLSSAERTEAEPDQDASVQLLSIFSRLEGEIPWEKAEAYYRLKPWTLDREALFPRQGQTSIQEAREEYSHLWDAFLSEVAKLPTVEFESHFLALYHLLQKYTWCVPAAGYRHVPDVSLFDHARTTCAIATCLELASVSEEELDSLLNPRRQEKDWQRPLFMLISADVSGVQSFIYTITSKGAARGLRGRSFYLQLLSEAAADYILRSLGLTVANLLYVGGGRFFILAPLAKEEKLAQIRVEMARAMLDVHHGELSLAIGSAALAPQDFLEGNFGAKWREASQSADEEKRRKMADIASEAYAAVFAPQGSGGPVATGNECDICGKAVGESGTIAGGIARCADCRGKTPVAGRTFPVKICDVCAEEVQEGTVSGGTLKCQSCGDFEDLGRQIADAREDRLIINLHHTPPGNNASAWQQKLWQIGKVWYSFGRMPEKDGPSFTIGESDFLARNCEGFRLLAAVTPHDRRDRSIKEFSRLASDAAGINRLGVLRMDVDDLGLLFQRGLGKNATISRVSSLSFHLRTFFEGWLNVICDEVEKDVQGLLPQDSLLLREERIYVIYAGGDDLFIVGSWDRIPILAERVHSDLNLFTADNPNVHISAGIVLADAGFPLYQSADAAHEALDGQAKKFSRNDGRRKDAISFLDSTMSWEEFALAKSMAFSLQRLIGEGIGDGASGRKTTMPKSIISNLSAIYRQYERDRMGPHAGRDRERVYYGRWMWLSAYSLRRFAQRLRSPGRALENEIEKLQKELTKPVVVRNLGLIARWSEFLLRNGKEGT